MGKHAGCYTEEQIVDLLLSPALDEEQQLFVRHREICVTCDSLALEWQGMLADVPHAQSENWSSSQKRVQGRIWSRLHGSLFKKQSSPRLRSKLLVGSGILGICFLLVLLLPALLDPEESQSLGEPIIQEEAIYYSLRSTTTPSLEGYVTINPIKEEVYIFVQGVPMMVNQDYQAWLVEGKVPIDMGLLRLKHGAGELYKQSKEVSTANTLRISIEPKGGSLYPTGPDFIFIPLYAP